jgi:hypothetical protein
VALAQPSRKPRNSETAVRHVRNMADDDRGGSDADTGRATRGIRSTTPKKKRHRSDAMARKQPDRRG